MIVVSDLRVKSIYALAFRLRRQPNIYELRTSNATVTGKRLLKQQHRREFVVPIKQVMGFRRSENSQKTIVLGAQASPPGRAQLNQEQLPKPHDEMELVLLSTGRRGRLRSQDVF